MLSAMTSAMSAAYVCVVVASLHELARSQWPFRAPQGLGSIDGSFAFTHVFESSVVMLSAMTSAVAAACLCIGCHLPDGFALS
jgi:hypothetical protein